MKYFKFKENVYCTSNINTITNIGKNAKNNFFKIIFKSDNFIIIKTKSLSDADVGKLEHERNNFIKFVTGETELFTIQNEINLEK